MARMAVLTRASGSYGNIKKGMTITIPLGCPAGDQKFQELTGGSQKKAWHIQFKNIPDPKKSPVNTDNLIVTPDVLFEEQKEAELESAPIEEFAPVPKAVDFDKLGMLRKPELVEIAKGLNVESEKPIDEMTKPELKAFILANRKG